jgi:heme/copper-type cytochrome/quinol oxidase subunit 3
MGVDGQQYMTGILATLLLISLFSGVAAAEERTYHNWGFTIEDSGYLGGIAGDNFLVYATAGPR